MNDHGLDEQHELELSGVDSDTAAARARALSSPTRWRVLRLCLHEARTNKELADLLGINPGSMLHHVRTLVSAGYLEAQQERRGARNAVEIPYLATPLTWSSALGGAHMNKILVEVLDQETKALDPEDVNVWRLGVCLPDELQKELTERIGALVEEFRERGAEHDTATGSPWSLMVFLHPDMAADPEDC